jgi:hypothetical protein
MILTRKLDLGVELVIGVRIENVNVINDRLPENLTRWLPTESTLYKFITDVCVF